MGTQNTVPQQPGLDQYGGIGNMGGYGNMANWIPSNQFMQFGSQPPNTQQNWGGWQPNQLSMINAAMLGFPQSFLFNQGQANNVVNGTGAPTAPFPGTTTPPTGTGTTGTPTTPGLPPTPGVGTPFTGGPATAQKAGTNRDLGWERMRAAQHIEDIKRNNRIGT